MKSRLQYWKVMYDREENNRNLFKTFASKSESNVLILLEIEEVQRKLHRYSGLFLQKQNNSAFEGKTKCAI